MRWGAQDECGRRQLTKARAENADEAYDTDVTWAKIEKLVQNITSDSVIKYRK
jgi:hypothetical protein